MGELVVEDNIQMGYGVLTGQDWLQAVQTVSLCLFGVLLPLSSRNSACFLESSSLESAPTA